jgi:hypothetical protein
MGSVYDKSVSPCSMHLPPDASGQRPVSYHTDDAEAAFTRLGPEDAVLTVKYRIPEAAAPVEGDDVRATVTGLCEAEVARMRAALTALGDGLATQLSDRGTTPLVTREWKSQDHREWLRREHEFRVAGSRTRLRDRIHYDATASEAGLVREHVRLMIEQRERDIRKVYGQVLADVTRPTEATETEE